MTLVEFKAEMALKSPETGQIEYIIIDIAKMNKRHAEEFAFRNIVTRRGEELVHAKFAIIGIKKFIHEYSEVLPLAWKTYSFPEKEEYEKIEVIPRGAPFKKYGVQYNGSAYVMNSMTAEETRMNREIMESLNQRYESEKESVIRISKRIGSKTLDMSGLIEYDINDGSYTVPITAWLKGTNEEFGNKGVMEYIGIKNLTIKENEDFVIYYRKIERKPIEEWEFIRRGDNAVPKL